MKAQVTEAHIDLSRAVNKIATIMGGAQLIADSEAAAVLEAFKEITQQIAEIPPATAALTAERDRLRAELAKERARLDWLQAQEVKRGFECGITADDPSFLVLGEDGTTHWGDTYREAVDAAMKGGKL